MTIKQHITSIMTYLLKLSVSAVCGFLRNCCNQFACFLLKIVVMIFTFTICQQQFFTSISSLCQLEVQGFNLIPFYRWASHLNMSSDFVQLLEQSFFQLKMWGVRSSLYLGWFSHLSCQALFSSYLKTLWMHHLLGATSLFV